MNTSPIYYASGVWKIYKLLLTQERRALIHDKIWPVIRVIWELHQTFWFLWCNLVTIFSFPFHQIAWTYWEKSLALLCLAMPMGWSACHFKGKFSIFSCRSYKIFLIVYINVVFKVWNVVISTCSHLLKKLYI